MDLAFIQDPTDHDPGHPTVQNKKFFFLSELSFTTIHESQD